MLRSPVNTAQICNRDKILQLFDIHIRSLPYYFYLFLFDQIVMTVPDSDRLELLPEFTIS